MDDCSTHHTDVEQLVTAGQRVELAREETLRETRHVQNGTECVDSTHQEEPSDSIDRVLVFKPVPHHHVDPGDKSVETEEKESGKSEWTVFMSTKLSPEREKNATHKEEDKDGYVDALTHSVAVESVVVGRDAGPSDEGSNPGVVEATEYAVDIMGVVAEEMEESGAREAYHGGQEETEQHGLLCGREFVDLNVLKEESDVVAVHVDPQAEGHEESKPQEVGPDIPGLRVHAEHAPGALCVRVHRRTVLVRQVLVLLHPRREFAERLRSPVARRDAAAAAGTRRPRRRHGTTVNTLHSLRLCPSPLHSRRIKSSRCHLSVDLSFRNGNYPETWVPTT